jgi:aminoglycoside 6-adenylyltransferase
MRTPGEIKKIILDKATADSRIRAVLLNGSRANQKISPDSLQDFDVLFIVEQMDSFITDHDWTSVFGEKLIWQLPDEMEFPNRGEKTSYSFHYLMLYKDGHRIDLTLFPREKIETDFTPESLTVVWLDKDNLFENIKLATDVDYGFEGPLRRNSEMPVMNFGGIYLYSQGPDKTDISCKSNDGGPCQENVFKNNRVVCRCKN